MQHAALATPVSNVSLWAGRIMTALPVAFMLFDGIAKLMKPDFVVKATLELGYPESTLIGIGLVLLVSTVLYMVPHTTVLGAVLLTGYLGGAVASHVRVGNPIFTHELFPVYLAILLWGGLYLREPRLRMLFPLRR